MTGSDRQARRNEAAILRGEEWRVKQRKAGLAYRSERFIPTADDWYPCYFEDEHHNSPSVKGTVMLGPPSGRSRMGPIHDGDFKWFVRICIWGNDDTGIERDFYFEDKEDAVEQYHRLVGWMGNLVVAQRYELLKLGFVPA